MLTPAPGWTNPLGESILTHECGSPRRVLAALYPPPGGTHHPPAANPQPFVLAPHSIKS